MNLDTFFKAGDLYFLIEQYEVFITGINNNVKNETIGSSIIELLLAQEDESIIFKDIIKKACTERLEILKQQMKEL